MALRCFKSILVAAFSLICLFFFNVSNAQPPAPNAGAEEANDHGKLVPAKLILEHVGDAHEFHFFTLNKKPVTIPLPVIVYSSGKGLSVFMSSKFEEGDSVYNGYRLLNEEYAQEHKLDEKVFKTAKIYAVDGEGRPDPSVSVIDLSLGRNAAQALVAAILLIFLMRSVAGQYKKGEGVKSAPTGFQNAVEPVITFVRDEVGKSNLGDKYEKYMPYLLTVFFFILINNLLGLIPGTANVTGNIAFTAAMGVLSFIVIMVSTGKHYWGHIVNPPVPVLIKVIMWPVEIMGIFTKPFALIIRLFANMISGHIIILSFIILIFIFGAMNTALGWGTSPLFVALSIFIYLIEVLVAFIQAYIFANLTAVFVAQAFEGGHDDEHGHHTENVAI